MPLLTMAARRSAGRAYDSRMDDTTQTRVYLARIEELAAAPHTEQQWLERLRSAAQSFLDRPNAVTRGKLRRILEALERRGQ